MSVDLEIKCIKKLKRFDPSSRITHIGGVHDGKRWLFTEEQAIKSVESKELSFYVTVGGVKIRAVVGDRKGLKFLKAETDKLTPDALVALPECP